MTWFICKFFFKVSQISKKFSNIFTEKNQSTKGPMQWKSFCKGQLLSWFPAPFIWKLLLIFHLMFEFFKIFNWKKIALQCCVGFFHTIECTRARTHTHTHTHTHTQCTDVYATFSFHPTLSFPNWVHRSVYIGVSILSLQIGSSISFSRLHIYALISNICFSLYALVCWTIDTSDILMIETRRK